MQKHTSRSLASSRFLQVQLVRFILFRSPLVIIKKTITLLALVGYEIIIANAGPRASLAIYKGDQKSGTPNENKVQNHLNIALLNVF